MEGTRSALGAQVKAIKLSDQKGWSLAAPLRPHLRADCYGEGSLIEDPSLMEFSLQAEIFTQVSTFPFSV